jgi:NADH-quinone oxidoreductase subunit A
MDLLNTIIAVILDGFLTGALILVISRMLVKPRQEDMKYESYECGDRSLGINRPRHDFHFYKYAFMFLVFDVGAMFFIFWAVLLDPFEFLVPIILFTAFLMIGLVYSLAHLGGGNCDS